MVFASVSSITGFVGYNFFYLKIYTLAMTIANKSVHWSPEVVNTID